MTNNSNEEWEAIVAQAKENERIEQRRLQRPHHSNWKLNLCLFVIPLINFISGFILPKQLRGLVFLAFVIGIFLVAGVLVSYATSITSSHEAKEAALSFLLGNLIVLGLFLLNPI